MLCEEWALGKILQQFSCVLLLPLREKKVSSAASLVDLLKLLDNREESRRCVADELEDNRGEEVLIIADGWDELEETQRSDNSFLYDLLFGDVLSLASVLLTSRPSTSASLHNLPSVNLVEITGFDEESVKDYIVSEFESDPEKASGLLQQLENNPFLRSVCSIPLNCAITCHLWHISAQDLPSTLTELYTQIILNVILRDIKKKYSEYENLKSLVNFDSIPSALQSSWLHVCEFAFNALSEDKLVFSQEELSSFFPEALDLDQELPCFGVLQSTLSLLPVGHCRSFNFLHLTFQEYLAAFHLLRLPTEKQLQVFETYFGSGPFNIRPDRFNMVWRFFFGLARAYCGSSSDIERVLIGCLERVRFPSYVFPQLILLLCHCAFESRNSSVSSYVADMIKGKSQFQRLLQFSYYELSAFSPNDYVTVIQMLSYNIITSCAWIKLTLHRCNLRNSDIEKLVHLLSNAKGKLSLDLSHNNITSKGLISLFSIAPLTFPASQTFILTGNQISGDGIRQVTIFNTLTDLDLSNNPLGVSGVQVLENAVLAEVMPNLARLGLKDVLTADVDINGALLATFIEAISSHCRLLTHLNLSNNKLGIPGAQAVGRVLSWLTQDKEKFDLDLDETMLGDEGITALSNSIVNTCTITELDIPNNDIHEEGVLSLMNCLSSGTLILETLRLYSNPLGYGGLLAVLKALCTDKCQLKYLYVNSCTDTSAPFASSDSQDDTISSTDFDQLLNLRPNTSIVIVDARYNNFSGHGVNVLAAFIQFCCSLEYLFSHGCQLTSKDLKCIFAQLSHLKSPQSTSSLEKPRRCCFTWGLSSNNIDDEGVAALIEHLPSLLPTLCSVYLDKNPVSEGMKRRLKEALDINEKAMVVAEWSKTSLPPQNWKLREEFKKMWDQLLVCILKECRALMDASRQPSCIVEIKDDMLEQSNQQTAHKENDQGLTSPVTDRTSAIDSLSLSTIPDGSTFTLESANTEPLGVENSELLTKPPPKKQKLQPILEDTVQIEFSTCPETREIPSDTPCTTSDYRQSQEPDISDIDIDKVDNTTRLDDDDFTEICDELRGLESDYYKLGRSLHLTSGTVKRIQVDNPSRCDTALVHVIDEWLNMNYNYSKFGPPSWQLLVKAVETVDHERAKQIAIKHPKV